MPARTNLPPLGGYRPECSSPPQRPRCHLLAVHPPPLLNAPGGARPVPPPPPPEEREPPTPPPPPPPRLASSARVAAPPRGPRGGTLCPAGVAACQCGGGGCEPAWRTPFLRGPS